MVSDELGMKKYSISCSSMVKVTWTSTAVELGEKIRMLINKINVTITTLGILLFVL
jgi:hypothetical protein